MSDATHNQFAAVAACTVDASHRRDHHHGDDGTCLGRRAVAVCHDCGRDSGFLPEREADRLAYAHRQESEGDECSVLRSWVA